LTDFGEDEGGLIEEGIFDVKAALLVAAEGIQVVDVCQHQ
jgi:hypothetical protein